MTIEQYRDRKLGVTLFVGVVSAVALLGTGDLESGDWAKIAIVMVGAYPLESIMQTLMERKK